MNVRSYKPLRLVIVGGVAAGMSAASRARRNDPRAEITVVQKESRVSYAACGLPYFISGDVNDENNLVARRVEEFAEQNIQVLLQHEALKLLPRKKSVQVRRLTDGKIFEIFYDKVIIATGARPVSPGIPGAELSNVFALRHFNDGLALYNFIKRYNPQKAVIIGSGYLGLEMAEALVKKGLNVTIVEQAERIMPSAEAEISERVQVELQKNDCSVYLNNSVRQIRGKETAETVDLGNGGTLSCDMIFLSTGVKANTDFARASGVQLGKSGAIAVGSRMETNLYGVYAAGDCTEVRNRVNNKNEYIPLGPTANKQGRVAADNATGKFARFNGVLGTAAVKVFDLQVARTGLSTEQALQSVLKFDSVVIKAHSRAGYYPGSQEMIVKLLFSKPDGHLLGGHICGYNGAAKRIDVLATALWNKMTVADIAELDLSYAPPFSPVWDPVLIAAQQAMKKLR